MTSHRVMRPFRIGGVILGLSIGCFLLSGCRAQTLPPVPPVFASGIAIYSDVNYGGESALVTSDIADLRQVVSLCSEVDTQDDAKFTSGSRTWTNCMSSVGVASGWRAILFANPDFSGASFETTLSVRDLRRVPGPCRLTLNDCVSSIKVFPPGSPD